MALKRVFERPRTLRRLGSGPLGKLLKGFCNGLREHGFRRRTIRDHHFYLPYFNEHLDAPSSAVRLSVSSKDVERFFKAYSLRCQIGDLDSSSEMEPFQIVTFVKDAGKLQIVWLSWTRSRLGVRR